MEENNVAALNSELARLEADEARLSAMRGHLQHQIDFGFETASTRDREREVSAERQEVHRRIDELRERIRSVQGV